MTEDSAARTADERPGTAAALDALAAADPRLSRTYTRQLDTGSGGDVVLVGVVHDHPASVHRVETVVSELDPDVLALEIPDLLVPLFEDYAGSDAPAGGEMAAAIAAARTERVVGVDAPDARSLRAVAGELLRERPSRSTVRDALASTSRLVAQTVRGRLHAAGVGSGDLADELAFSQSYDCTAADSPADQATHESSHLRRSTTLLEAFEVPPATRILDAARERAMAERVNSLARDRTVVAVVGYSHLDGVVANLAAD